MPKETHPPGNSFAIALYEWLQAVVLALVAIILIFTMVGRLTPVDGTSMSPTLEDKDMMLVQSIGYTPRAGDVVVFTKAFRSDISGPLVKRVIAVGGQTVEIDYDLGTVSVDGAELEEPYIKEAMLAPGNPYLTNNNLTVPEGSIFVMGDNRNGSDDSRDVRLGTVDTRYVLGRASFVLFPFANFGPV